MVPPRPAAGWHLAASRSRRRGRASRDQPRGEADMQYPLQARIHIFGGDALFKVLSQMGGCPAEFVDAYNDAIDSRFRDSSFVDLMSGLCIAQTPRALPRSHCSRFGARCAPKWSTQFALRRAKRAETVYNVTMSTHLRAKRARSGHNC